MNEQDKRPAEIEREIGQTRADVGATIDAIQSKLTPGQMMDQALAYVRTSLPADFSRNLADTTRNNPMPVALIGIGIAWLAISGRQGSMGNAGRPYESSARDSPEDGWDDGLSMTERARQVSRTARERVSERVDDARNAINRASDRSRESYDRARSTVSHVIDEQPLVLGAIGLAAGAALGALLPRTAAEDEWLGAASDSTKSSAVDTARELADRAAERTRQAMRQTDRDPIKGTIEATDARSV